MSATTDYQIKKSCLDQLTLVLFDVKRSKVLFKNETSAGARNLFAFLIHEIVQTHNTCTGYLQDKTSFLDVSHQAYINECFRFIFTAAVLLPEEPEIKGFFSKIRQLYSQKELSPEAKAFEQFINATVFLCGSQMVR